MMASLWQHDYHWLIPKHFKVNLFICLHLVMNSSRVLRREEGSAFAIVTFSVRHRSHFRVQPLQGRFLEVISQLIWCWMLFPFRSQIRLEISVLFRLLLFLNVAVWLCCTVLWKVFHKFHENICLFVKKFVKLLLYR